MKRTVSIKDPAFEMEAELRIVMTRCLLLLVLVAALPTCVRARSVSGDIVPSVGHENVAAAIEREVVRLSAVHGRQEALWPGYDPLAVPLAVYDGEHTYLFRHPSPPEGFLRVPADSTAAWVWTGRHEAVVANTSAEIGGVPTATILLDRPQMDRSLLDLAAVAVHEAFHVDQRTRHPGWIGNEADVFMYPAEAADLLVFRRLETEALRRALATNDAAGAARWARKALALRGERYARMDSAFAAYERGTELNEGLATYVEMRAAGRREVDLPPEDFRPAEVRRRAYATGHALARLLDRFAPGWPAGLDADDRQVLDRVLARALGPGEVGAFGDSLVAAAEEKAHADVVVLAAERKRLLDELEKRPGWRVVVEVSEVEPLWPQGFDPINVTRLAGTRVLHTRFLRLGNSAGRVEVLNAEALTEGIGPHPLLQGVRRVVLPGVAEPEVTDSCGRVTVRVPGLTVEFDGARVTRGKDGVTVRLGA